jgi:hypothetical protein
MKRIILMLALTALLVVALSLSAVTAFADIRCDKERGVTTCQHGNAGKVTEQHHGAPGSQGSAV